MAPDYDFPPEYTSRYKFDTPYGTSSNFDFDTYKQHGRISKIFLHEDGGDLNGYQFEYGGVTGSSLIPPYTNTLTEVDIPAHERIRGLQVSWEPLSSLYGIRGLWILTDYQAQSYMVGYYDGSRNEVLDQPQVTYANYTVKTWFYSYILYQPPGLLRCLLRNRH